MAQMKAKGHVATKLQQFALEERLGIETRRVEDQNLGETRRGTKNQKPKGEKHNQDHEPKRIRS